MENIVEHAKSVLFNPFLTKLEYRLAIKQMQQACIKGSGDAAFVLSEAYRYGLWCCEPSLAKYRMYLTQAAKYKYEIACAILFYKYEKISGIDVSNCNSKYSQAIILEGSILGRGTKLETKMLLLDHYMKTKDVFALIELYSRNADDPQILDILVDHNFKPAILLKIMREPTCDIRYLVAFMTQTNVYKENPEHIVGLDAAISRLVLYFTQKGHLRKAEKMNLLSRNWVRQYWQHYFKIGTARPSGEIFFIYWKAIVCRNYYILQSNNTEKKNHIENVHVYYARCISSAKAAALTWLCVAKKLKTGKDTATMIAKRIWRSRKNPDYWILLN